MGGAAIVLGIDDGEAAAADAARPLSRYFWRCAVQRVAVGIPAHVQADLRLPGLDRVPERVVDDAQLGHRHDLPLLARVRARHPVAGARVLDVGTAVPFQTPGIERVVEDAGRPVELPADGGVPPGTSGPTRGVVHDENGVKLVAPVPQNPA